MAISYYDDAIMAKIKGWLADSSTLRVLGPDETKRAIELNAEDTNDASLRLPLLTISRNKELEITNTIKQNKSFDGLVIQKDSEKAATVHMNVIPVKTLYQLDIYTKKQLEADEYVRQFLFKLINNPQIIVEIPYNNYIIKHTANLRVLNSVSDTSDVPNHFFPGQFYRWTIQLELQDGFLFSIPYKKNWKFVGVEFALCDRIEDPPELDIVEQIIC